MKSKSSLISVIAVTAIILLAVVYNSSTKGVVSSRNDRSIKISNAELANKASQFPGSSKLSPKQNTEEDPLPAIISDEELKKFKQELDDQQAEIIALQNKIDSSLEQEGLDSVALAKDYQSPELKPLPMLELESVFQASTRESSPAPTALPPEVMDKIQQSTGLSPEEVQAEFSAGTKP